MLDPDEFELIEFYDAVDALNYAAALGATDVRQLLIELHAARRLGLSCADYWAGPAPDGELH